MSNGSRIVVLSFLAIVSSTACATAQAPADLKPMWQCTGNPRPDIVIPVKLSLQNGVCKATIEPTGSGNPRACRNSHAIWRVTNECGEEYHNLRVVIGFSPFDKNHRSGRIGNGGSKDIKARVRPKARATYATTGPCPNDPNEVCGPAYKYDIYILRPGSDVERLDLDPELEVEY